MFIGALKTADWMLDEGYTREQIIQHLIESGVDEQAAFFATCGAGVRPQITGDISPPIKGETHI